MSPVTIWKFDIMVTKKDVSLINSLCQIKMEELSKERMCVWALY